MIESVWYGCYDESLKGIITAQSFKHPAKMAKLLCQRIFEHGEELGYWQPGDVIGEPFAGIFTVGVLGAYRGYQVVGNELEPHFYELAQANIDKNRKKLLGLGKPLPLISLGDSRQFASLVGVALSGLVTSPPYAGSVHDGNGIDPDKLTRNVAGVYSQAFNQGYGNHPNNIGTRREGGFEQAAGIVTSPPFGPAQTGGGIAVNGYHNEAQRKGEFDLVGKRSYMPANHGETDGQIGNLPISNVLDGAITSPPYADNNKHDHTHEQRDERRLGKDFKGRGRGSFRGSENYGDTDGQIGNLDGAVTSPPYADQSIAKSSKSIDLKKQYETYRSQGGGASYEKFVATQQLHTQEYGTSDGQIGVLPSQESTDKKETYWQAMLTVYQQMYLSLRPGGVAAIVVKDYIRDKQRVPLCDQTALVLERVGFTIVERTRAMLVKEHSQPSLMQIEDTSISTTNFLDETTEQAGAAIGEMAVSERKERMSFFRRLHGKKYPDLKIEWEEVIWAQKPSGAGGG